MIVLCCWCENLTLSSGSLWGHSLFHSSVEIWSHYSSANVDPVFTCQRFLLRLAHLELFNTNGQSLFPLCSTCHVMCHFDWQRNGGPICKCCLPVHPVWKDIHQKPHVLFTCLLVILSARRCQGRCGVDHPFSSFERPMDHMTGVKYGWAIKVHFFSVLCLVCEINACMHSTKNGH